ncbi:hypothetical protein A2210_01445 [Candidatus Woesebacteria bacterium RIFOXYA1_FULL_40_18]|uniref:Bacterial Ig domain-containing protein n=2 Tax=Candidatus Woeseibacteriota TaxID=1752722 RepID=A0A1F8CI45_9BACT|nr:MAG: hypothetical protein A2210_01445 [Candidatus Woesebacteria bacterium RIFOXYA1_FULL_40_18]OGM80361.1 MAG: hypothetical protein A2361_02890 [Candidatus Woesebacteria bacterium RIFOXYB1_FULL_40_26]
MRRFYSRLASVEEKRNVRAAFVLVILTIISLIALFTFGLPSVAKFASFVADLKKGNVPVEKNDTTPPAPPKIKNLPEATNQESLIIEGTSESGAEIQIFLNDNPSEVVAGENGTFSFSANLEKGTNSIYLVAKDKSGNLSQKSQAVMVILDKETPNLDITSPKDGQQFSGSLERQIIIEGKTEAKSSLTINDRLVKVEEDGSFSFSTSLSEGDNSFNLKVSDLAGNKAEKSLTVKFAL